MVGLEPKALRLCVRLQECISEPPSWPVVDTADTLCFKRPNLQIFSQSQIPWELATALLHKTCPPCVHPCVSVGTVYVLTLLCLRSS